MKEKAMKFLRGLEWTIVLSAAVLTMGNITTYVAYWQIGRFAAKNNLRFLVSKTNYSYCEYYAQLVKGEKLDWTGCAENVPKAVIAAEDSFKTDAPDQIGSDCSKTGEPDGK